MGIIGIIFGIILAPVIAVVTVIVFIFLLVLAYIAICYFLKLLRQLDAFFGPDDKGSDPLIVEKYTKMQVVHHDFRGQRVEPTPMKQPERHYCSNDRCVDKGKPIRYADLPYVYMELVEGANGKYTFKLTCIKCQTETQKVSKFEEICQYFRDY